MGVHTQPKKLGIGLLLAAFLNSACAPHNQPVQSHSMAARPQAEPTPLATAGISPEDAAIRAVNTLTPTEDGYHLHHPHYTATFKTDGVTFQPKREEVRWQWHLTEVGTTAGPLAGVTVEKVRPKHATAQTVVYHRGALDEQYVARKSSIEQQFIIPQLLALQGEDLRIRGQVRSGGEFENRHEHWVWRGEDQGIWLGQVYVYDAQGTTVPSRLDVSQGETTIVIDGQALARASYPVVVDPEIGVNDFRISDMGPDGNGKFQVFDPAVAYNTTSNEYLVVWAGDDNTGKLVDNELEIFGQRLDGATGAHIGVNDFRISDMGLNKLSEYGHTYSPAVAYSPTNNEYLVVWEGRDYNGTDLGIEIYGQRLAGATGAEIGADDFLISHVGFPEDNKFDEWSFYASSPAAAYNPTHNEYLVVWASTDNTGTLAELELEIYGQRLAGATGAEIGADDFRISDMGPDGDEDFDAELPKVAYNPTNNEYLVVWDGADYANPGEDPEFEVFGQRLAGTTGVEIGVNDFRINGTDDKPAGLPAVAYNPTNNEYLVVWVGSEPLIAVYHEIYGQRLAGSSGAKIGVSDFRISQLKSSGAITSNPRDPTVAYNPTNNEYLVAWTGDDNPLPQQFAGYEIEIYGQRLDGATGAEIGTNDFRLSDMGVHNDPWRGARDPAVAHNSANNEYLIVWGGNDTASNLVDEETEIYGQRWSSCGDGVVDPGEECEPSDKISVGGVGSCTPECTINLCGNGVVDDFEDCDLGLSNGLPGSDCTFTCQQPSILNLERLTDLVASCELCPPEVRGSLVDLLSRTQAQLDKGNLRAALNTLQQFVKKTQQFLRKGQLPDVEGRRLQMQAEVIIAQLEEQLAER